MEYSLLQAVFVPLLLSPLAYLVGRRYGMAAATWLAFGILLYCTALIVYGSVEGKEERYPWTEMFGGFGFSLDGLASPFAIMIYVLCTIIALYSRPYMEHKFAEQYREEHGGEGGLQSYVNAKSGALLCAVPGLRHGDAGHRACHQPDTVLRLLRGHADTGFFLIAFWGDGPRRRIALMFLFWTHVGAVVLLLGFLMIGLGAGTFDLDGIDAQSLPAGRAAGLGRGHIDRPRRETGRVHVPHMAALRPRGRAHAHQRAALAGHDRHRRLRHIPAGSRDAAFGVRRPVHLVPRSGGW